MSYHSHKLNSAQSHIIGRTDPITGDKVNENDKVVFCAVCRSCFLEESWVYMKERHCEQSQTLETAPTLPFKLIAKKRSEEMILGLRNEKVNAEIVIATTISTFLFFWFGLAALNKFFAFKIEAPFIISLITTIFSGITSGIINTIPKFKKILGDDENDIRLFENRIEIGNDSFLWSDIKQIKYQREMYIEYLPNREEHRSHTPCLLIYLKNGYFLKKNLPTKEYQQTVNFLRALEKISHFVEILFYSENRNEYQSMLNIEVNSNGNVKVEEPIKLLN